MDHKRYKSMNKIFKIALTVSILLIVNLQLSAQKECKDYHVKKCGGYGPPYKYSGQSRSASFEVGESSSFQMSAFEGFEYCITLCSSKQLKGIHFRIIEDNAQKTVLYDGANDESGMLQKEFYIKNSKKLLIEVICPEMNKEAEDINYDRLNGCVGVIIEYHKIGKKGFN